MGKGRKRRDRTEDWKEEEGKEEEEKRKRGEYNI